MRAVLLSKYGGPDQLRISEIPKPSPGKHQVLVNVETTAVNDYDWSMVTGQPAILRLMFGISRPKNPIPGMELAGVVESTGEGVTKFKPGDRVFGDTSNHGFGTFAEYMAIHEDSLLLMSESMSFEEAVTLPHASMLAYQGLHTIGKMAKGQTLLVNGGGGGVGMIAVQLAKALDIEVTGVDSGEKLSKMHEMGYDRVLDYKQIDFARQAQKYDLILDCKSKRGPFNVAKALKPKGHYISIGGAINSLLKIFFLGKLVRLFAGKRTSILALNPNFDMEKIKAMFENKKLTCIIDGPYPLEEIAAAVRKFGEGRHTGKVVIKI